MNECAPLPKLDEALFFSPEILRQAAVYPFLADCLETRTGAVARLVRQVTQREFKPSADQLASTIEQGAAYILRKRESTTERWEQFWTDASRMLPAVNHRPHPLLGRRVVLSGGALVARSSDSEEQEQALFTLPLEQEGEEGELGITDVPPTLAKRVRFLDQDIPTRKTDSAGRRIKSLIRDYLLQGSPPLVDEFRRREIFTRLLIPFAHSGPVPLGSYRATECRDILLWAIRLVESARGTETLITLLADLRVPCRGGWYPVREVSFGPGWTDDTEDPGALLEAVLQGVENEAESRLLLPPNHPEWGTDVRHLRQTLIDAGVAVGLRLREIKGTEWKNSFQLTRNRVPTLPPIPPPRIDPTTWKDYTEHVAGEIEGRYSGWYEYKITNLHIPDGFASWGNLDRNKKISLTKVILRSLTEWNSGDWRDCRVVKQGGEPHSQVLKSPLRHVLEALPWICFEREREFLSFRPAQLLLIPSSQLEWGRHQFDHLDYLPVDLIRRVDSSPGAAEALQGIGIAVYPGDTKSADVRFLESLAAAVANNRFNPSNRGVMLGQLYAGWGAFKPDHSGRFPTFLVVSRGRFFESIGISAQSVFYLPDEDRGAVELLKREGHPVLEIRVPDAKRLKSDFENSCGDTVKPLSKFTVTPLVDGLPWSAGGDEQNLSTSEIGWIPAVTLAVAAYAGNSAPGTHSKAFIEGVKRLRRAKIAFRKSISLRADLEGETLFEHHDVPSVWLPDSETLLVDRSVEGWMESLAESIEEILERGDLESSLRLTFSKLNRIEVPTIDQKVEALRAVRVNADQLSEAERVWLGDFTWLIHRAIPAIKLIVPEFDTASLTDIRNEAELISLLEPFWVSKRPPIDELLSIARGASSNEEVGRELFARLGLTAELHNWNQTLLNLGEPYLVVRNREVQDQFATHLIAIRTCVYSILRNLACSKNQPQLYIILRDEFDQLRAPEEVEWQVWEVSFPMAMGLVNEFLTRHMVDEPERRAVKYARDANDLIDKLTQLGLDPKIDPAELFTKNLALCQKALETVLKVGLVLAERQDVVRLSWTEPMTPKIEQLKQEFLSGTGYLQPITEKLAISHVLRLIPKDTIGSDIRAKAVLVERIEDLPTALGLKLDDLHDADTVISRAQEEDRRRRRQVDVCGEKFDADESNLENLLSHISERVPIEAVSGLDLGCPADLKKMLHRKPEGARGGGSGGRQLERLSETERNVIGLAGEIHVWRALKQKFGDDVTAASWVSENRKYVFTDKPGNDSLGYDFDVTTDGTTYRIEVKATHGDSPEFELGPSQIRCAARIGSRRKERYLIVHVTRALSTNPQLVILPNPYDPRYADRFRFYDTSALSVAYRKEAASEISL